MEPSPERNGITGSSLVTDIIAMDYRTATVFTKYEINFCCGARFPLETACMMRGLDLAGVKTDLENAMRPLTISPLLNFSGWETGFLTEYIVHIHHAFLQRSLPETREYLKQFADGHRKKYNWLPELETLFYDLTDRLSRQISREETLIFPYIRQLQAYNSMHPYADPGTHLYGLIHSGDLLPETPPASILSSPARELDRWIQEHAFIREGMERLSALTGHYTPPANACTSHKVCFFMLAEIDRDISQCYWLEETILFPRLKTMTNSMASAMATPR